MVTGREMREKLHKGERVYGTMSAAVSPRWPGIARDSGLDFLMIDSEHNALGREDLSWMCQVCLGVGVVPVVRMVIMYYA